MSTLGREADLEWERRKNVHQLRNGKDHSESRIKLTPFEQLKPGTDRQYLIKNLVPRVGLTVVWGPPKSGKSFWTFDMVMHVALGWPYRNRRVEQGAVVYCAFEGQTGLRNRAEAFRQSRLAEEAEPVPFYLVPMALDLASEHTALVAAINATGVMPATVVLDTLNRSLAGSESSDEDMGAYIKAADAIREAFDCAVIVVHHCGVNDSRPRGHTSLTGAADAQLSVKRDPNGSILVTVEWMKDGSGEGDTLASRLETVEVGTDEDGEPITSCVVIEDEAPTTRLPSGPKLTANQRTMLGILRESGPAGLATDEWVNKAKAEGIGENRKATFFDIRRWLHDKKLVHTYCDRWYITGQL
jgi:hypothetical protein